MTKTGPERVADFIAEHPGCGVREIEFGVPVLDAAQTWAWLIDAEHKLRAILSDNSDGGTWHFWPDPERGLR